ncbi:MAG: ABC transporter ATP-binding protein [Limisphaerales bacterium]
MSDAIEIRGLVKKFSRFALGPVDLTVPYGAIYGLIGPNGAGKTTTIDMIFGLGRSDSGTIRVLGFDHRADAVRLKERTAYVSPELNFQIWSKVGNAVRFVRGFYPGWDDAYCAELMKVFRLGASDRIATLSTGAKTKLSLLLAMARRPEVLVLDEPVNGLDPIAKQFLFGELLKVVEDERHAVLISSQNLADLERFADHVGLLKNGQLLLEGRTDEIVERYRLAEFFTSNGTTLQSPPPVGLRILRWQDNRWRALVDQRSQALEWLKDQGARDVSQVRLTLEDLFIALVKEEEGS